MLQIRREEEDVDTKLKSYRKKGIGLSADRIIGAALDSFASSNDTFDLSVYVDERKNSVSTLREKRENVGGDSGDNST